MKNQEVLGFIYEQNLEGSFDVRSEKVTRQLDITTAETDAALQWLLQEKLILGQKVGPVTFYEITPSGRQTYDKYFRKQSVSRNGYKAEARWKWIMRILAILALLLALWPLLMGQFSSSSSQHQTAVISTVPTATSTAVMKPLRVLI